jgi:hypothetical protein
MSAKPAHGVSIAHLEGRLHERLDAAKALLGCEREHLPDLRAVDAVRIDLRRRPANPHGREDARWATYLLL